MRAASLRALVLVALVALGPTSAEATGIRARQRATATARSRNVIFDGADAAVDTVVDGAAAVSADGSSVAVAPPAKGISEGSAKQIVAVINTLKDILASVKNEEREETSNFNGYVKWCDMEIKSFSQALDNTQKTAEQGEVSNKELSATQAHLNKELEDMKALMDELKDSIDQAESIRSEEKDKYDDEMQLNRQSLNQINQAIKIVGKVHNKGGFLQNGVLQRLQLNEPGESNYVLGIMKGLLDKLTKTRAELEAEEKTQMAMDVQFMSTKKGQVKSTQTESAEKKVKLTEVRINLVSLEASVKRAKKQLEEITMILDQTKRECAEKKKAFAIRSKDRQQEKAAIQQAIDFLTKSNGKAAFLQMEQAAPSFLQLDAIPQTPAQVLAQLSTSSRGDFKGAKGVVTKLIGILQKQQTDEDDKNKYCEAEIAKKTDEKTDTGDEINQIAADIGSKQGTISTLADEVKDMQAEVVTMRRSTDEAAAIRKKEKASFEASSKDRALAVKVLRQAELVLNSFYATQDNTALLQKKHKAVPKRSERPKTWSPARSSRKTIRGNIVTEMLDKVALEITEEQKKAAAEEEKAQASFEELVKETFDETEKLRQDITERVKSKAKLIVQANSAKEMLGQRKEDRKAVVAQIKALHEECDQLLKNYASRKKARAFEVDQLKDVLDILAGSSITQRTNLLDTSMEMSEKEAALLRDMGAPTKVEVQARKDEN